MYYIYFPTRGLELQFFFCSVELKIFSYISSPGASAFFPPLLGNNKPVCDLLYKNFLISACMSDTVCTIPKKKKITAVNTFILLGFSDYVLLTLEKKNLTK